MFGLERLFGRGKKGNGGKPQAKKGAATSPAALGKAPVKGAKEENSRGWNGLQRTPGGEVVARIKRPPVRPLDASSPPPSGEKPKP